MRRNAGTTIAAAIVGVLIACGSALASDCRKVGTACADTTAVKNISGVNVTLEQVGGCWKYEDTYECLEPGSTDYCAALDSTPGCAITSTTCSATDFNGDCMTTQRIYQCGNSVPVGAGVVVLDDTHTISYDGVDRSACAAVDSNPSCQIASHTCVEGPETRNINGLDVYKDCWAWSDSYTCVVSNPVDYCSALATAGCARTSSECTDRSPLDDSCIATRDTYNCNTRQEPVPTNVTYLESSYTIVSDAANTQACDEHAANPNCSLAAHTCVEGPETRNINGLDVYKDCWRWSDEYTCTQNTPVSDCDDLKNNPKCTETNVTCVSYQDDGTTCNVQEHEYKCATGDSETTTVTDCSSQQFCIAGDCFDTGYPRDTDFGTVISGLEIQREAGYNNLFEGEGHKCKKKLFGLVNCCKKNNAAAGSSNSLLSQAVGTAAFSAGAETIRYLGSPYVFDALMRSGIGGLQQFALESLGGRLLSPNWSMSFYGAKIQYSFLDSAFSVSFDPWSLGLSIAIHLISQWLACEEEDQITGALRGQGLCHKVGSYCSHKVLGSCITKKESYCCFNSKLARIIHQQGRPQIGRTWGDEKSPDCSGFTLDQIGRLNFDRMNFGEFIRDVMRTVPARSSEFAVERATTRARSYYDD